jgi:hypothetical protein
MKLIRTPYATQYLGLFVKQLTINAVSDNVCLSSEQNVHFDAREGNS